MDESRAADVAAEGVSKLASDGASNTARAAATGERGQARSSRLLTRRRRANAAGGRQTSHRVKVTPEEEGVLQRLALAQGVTVPRLLVETTLAAETSSVTETPTDRRNAMAELFALHRLLAAISNNVNQMARATNATGEVAAEMGATLQAARRTAERIDAVIDDLAAVR